MHKAVPVNYGPDHGEPDAWECRVCGEPTVGDRHAGEAPAPPADEHAYLPGAPRDTQIDAAVRVLPRTGTQRRRVYDYLAGCPNGATDEEMTVALGLGGNSVRPRRLELVEAGLIRDSGDRRRTAGGEAAIVWTLADGGGEMAATA